MKRKCLPSVNYKFFYVRKLLKMPSKESKRKELRTIGESDGQGKTSFVQVTMYKYYIIFNIDSSC